MSWDYKKIEGQVKEIVKRKDAGLYGYREMAINASSRNHKKLRGYDSPAR